MLTGCDSGNSVAVGPEGGELVSRDGRFALEIPPGALSEAVDLAVEQVPCTLDGAIGDCYAVSPRGVDFLRPAGVSYELAELEADPRNVGVVAETDTGWRALADRVVDADDQVVYGSVMYVTEYTITHISRTPQ